jgi:hypothetical protein
LCLGLRSFRGGYWVAGKRRCLCSHKIQDTNTHPPRLSSSSFSLPLRWETLTCHQRNSFASQSCRSGCVSFEPRVLAVLVFSVREQSFDGRHFVNKSHILISIFLGFLTTLVFSCSVAVGGVVRGAGGDLRIHARLLASVLRTRFHGEQPVGGGVLRCLLGFDTRMRVGAASCLCLHPTPTPTPTQRWAHNTEMSTRVCSSIFPLITP